MDRGRDIFRNFGLTSVSDPAYPQKCIVFCISGWNGSHGPGSIVGPEETLGPEVAVGTNVALGWPLGALDGSSVGSYDGLPLGTPEGIDVRAVIHPAPRRDRSGSWNDEYEAVPPPSSVVHPTSSRARHASSLESYMLRNSSIRSCMCALVESLPPPSMLSSTIASRSHDTTSIVLFTGW